MSKLLKSKFLLGVLMVAVMVAIAVPALAADGAVTMTLKYGVNNIQVKYLQQTLNEKGFTIATAGHAGSVGMETSFFGNATKAAVKAYQAANSLVADGIFGPKSRAALGGVVVNPTGALCPNGMTLASNCTVAPTGTPVVNPTGPVAVALAVDNPASGSFIVPASGVQFAKYTFTGTGTVTSVKLMRTGVSASTTLSNVYLYDGATRITDGSSISSDNTVTFNTLGGIFTVAGSKTITVVADTLVADYSLGFTLVGYTANGTASTVSVAGNQMYGAGATLAIVTMSGATGSGDTDAGADITVWQGTATVATRDVLLKSLALRNVGSIAAADIKNFKLYADGVLVTTVPSLDANGYVTFATSTALKTGARILKVTADVVGGSGRTVQMSLRGSYDFQATDTQYNANGTTAGTFPFGPSAFTVNAGSVTVVKATASPSSNLTLGASDQNLATYTFTAYGEAIKIETLKVGILNTGGGAASVSLRNGRVLVNGAQVGSNTTIPAEASFAVNTGTQFTTNFIVYPGTPATVEIHADIFDNEGTDEIATPGVTALQVALVGGTGSNNATRQVSLGTINVPSTTASNGVVGNVLTIASGTMSLAKTSSYASRYVAVPATAYKIGSFQLTGNSTEAVNLNTIYIGWPTGSTVVESTSLSDLYVVYGGTMTTVKGTVTSDATGANASENSNSWSINRVLAINETIQIDVYATLASSVAANAIIAELAVAGTTASSGVATYADLASTTSLSAGVPGQTITGAAGSLLMSVDVANTASAQIVDDSATIKTLTAKVVATTDSYSITAFTVTVSGGVSAVSTATLKDHDTGAVIGAAKPAQTSMTWSGLEYPVVAGTTKRIDVELALAPVGVSAGTSDGNLATVISTYTARDSAGTSSASGSGTVSGDATGNAIYVYKAIPLLTALTLPNSTLAAGTNKVIAKFAVSSNTTGTIAWKQIMFDITKTATPVLSAVAVYNADTGEQITAAEVFQNSDEGSDADCDGSDTTCELLVTIGTNADDDAMEQVSTTKNYEIRATIAGSIVAADNLSVSVDRNTTTHGTADDFVARENDGTVSTETFVWSDESGTTTGDTAAATTTWMTDYLVKNLPMSWNLD